MNCSNRLRRFLFVAVAITAMWTALPLETVAQLVAGNEFVVPLPSFWRRKDGGVPGNFQITIMCSRRTTVTVKWSGPDGGLIDQAIVNGGDRLTVQPPRFPVVNLMQEFEDRKPFEVNQRSFYIETDQPVTVQAFYDQYFNSASSRTEYYTIPPIRSYGTEFTNLTYQGHKGKNTGFIVMAAEDDTEVTFVPNVLWNVPSEEPDIPVTLKLDKYQVYQVLSNQTAGQIADLSGTPITSDKPIGVIAFSLSTNAPDAAPPEPPMVGDPVPLWPTSTSPVAEVVLPEDQGGGTVFYTVPMANQDSSYLRIGILEDGTNIEVNGIEVFSAVNRGEYYSIGIDKATKVVSSKPVQIRQVSRSNNVPEVDTVLNPDKDPPDTFLLKYGNPAMAMLPPVSYYKRTLQWTSPRPENRPFSPGDTNFILVPWYHYALVTAPVSTLSTVRLDGQPIKFDYTHIDGQYASAIVPVLPRQHILEADEPISCIVYGFGWNDAYATISGEALRSIARVDIDSIVLTTCDTLATAEFNLSNLGNNNYQIDSIDADGIKIQNIQNPIGFPTEMPPGRILGARINFVLPQPGTYTGTLRVYTDANNENVLNIPFRIVRDSARISIPSLVEFGVVDADETSFDTLVTLRNDGENPVTINTLSFDDPRFEITQPSTPVTIPPGGSRSVGVRFTPRPGRSEEGTLRILGEPCFTAVDVSFTGFQGAGALLGVPRDLTIDPYLCDAPESFDTLIVVSSIGDEPLEITANQITGRDLDKFTLLNSIAGQTILPGETDTLRVRYQPTLFGVHEATLELSTNAQNAGNPVMIALNGRKDTTIVLPKTRTLDFGELLSCDEPKELTLTFSNNGTVDAFIESIEGLQDLPFTVVESLPIQIPPAGIERSVTVRFAPGSDGDFTTVMRLVGDPCGIAEEITLQGSRATPSLAVDKPILEIDTLYLCEGGTSAQFTLTNNGQVTDSITRVTPAGSSIFSLQDPSFPIVLEPGASRELSVDIAPDAAGDFIGSLEFAWGPCNNITVVDIEAVVVEPDISLSAASLDFGQVDYTDAPTRRTITVTNESVVNRTISSIDPGGSGSLSVVQPASLPVTLAPGESLEIEIEYAPQSVETLSVTATVVAEDPCGEDETFTVTGEAVGEDIILGELTIEVPDNLQGNVSERIQIPVRVRDGQNLAAVAPSRVEVGLSWRYTMLLPEDASTSIAGMNATILNNEIQGDRRLLRISFSGGEVPSDGTLGTVTALVLLGDRMDTDLQIDTVIVEAPSDPERIVNIGRDNGSFSVLGVCEIDGNRLVHIGSGLKLSAPEPNPVRDEGTIVFSLEESGYVEMVLYDLMGNEHQRLVAEELPSGSYSAQIDGSRLESGIYICELRSKSYRLHKTIIIQR